MRWYTYDAGNIWGLWKEAPWFEEVHPKRDRSQDALVKQSCSIGHSICKRRPIDLIPEQSASINTHPQIRSLTLALRKLRKEFKDYGEVH